MKVFPPIGETEAPGAERGEASVNGGLSPRDRRIAEAVEREKEKTFGNQPHPPGLPFQRLLGKFSGELVVREGGKVSYIPRDTPKKEASPVVPSIAQPKFWEDYYYREPSPERETGWWRDAP